MNTWTITASKELSAYVTTLSSSTQSIVSGRYHSYEREVTSHRGWCNSRIQKFLNPGKFVGTKHIQTVHSGLIFSSAHSRIIETGDTIPKLSIPILIVYQHLVLG